MTTGDMGRQPTFDEVTAWLRENHLAAAPQVYADTSTWYCSCGAGDSLRTMKHGYALAARDRHLRAARRRYEKQF